MPLAHASYSSTLVFALICSTVLCFAFIVFKIKKDPEGDNQPIPNHSIMFNNQATNASMLSYKTALILSFGILLLAFTTVMTQQFDSIGGRTVNYLFYMIYGLITHALPSTYFWVNPKAFKKALLIIICS